MKIMLFSMIATVGMAFAAPLIALDRSPLCYRQIQTTFFREDLLTAALGLYLVDQSMWNGIYQDLQLNAQRVPALVQWRAKATNPNPLDPIFDPQGATKVLQDSLYEVFYGVMQFYAASSNNIIDRNTVLGIFNYLWQQQYNSIAPCLKNGR